MPRRSSTGWLNIWTRVRSSHSGAGLAHTGSTAASSKPRAFSGRLACEEIVLLYILGILLWLVVRRCGSPRGMLILARAGGHPPGKGARRSAG